MNQEDFELNENESIKNILTRGVVCQKNIEFKSKIKAMIQYCDKPVLVQLEEAKYTTQLCKSYAVGGTGIAGRENEDTDNAKYYYEQMKFLIDSIENGDEVKY